MHVYIINICLGSMLKNVHDVQILQILLFHILNIGMGSGLIQILHICVEVKAIPDITHMWRDEGYSSCYTYVVGSGLFQILNICEGIRTIPDITPMWRDEGYSRYDTYVEG